MLVKNNRDISGFLRITGGEFRGRKISTPGGTTHPMGERERNALFNMLADEVVGAVVLDAFAGSGALGFEALSRGADLVYFVENNNTACETIRKNALNLGVSERVSVVKRGVGAVSEEDFGGFDDFDIILADPPYTDFRPEEVAKLVRFLNENGIFALSHPENANLGEFMELAVKNSGDKLSLLKTRKYAGARISVFS